MQRVMIALLAALISLAAASIGTQAIAAPSVRDASCVPLEFYGGAGDGVRFNDAAWASATAAKTANICVVFGPGVYKFNAAISKTLAAPAVTGGATSQSLALVGAGQGATILYWPSAGGGLTVVYGAATDSVNIGNMTLTTGAAAGGNAIYLTTRSNLATNVQNTIWNVGIRGYDAQVGIGSAYYWNAGVKIFNEPYVNLYGVDIWGGDVTLSSFAGSISGATLTVTGRPSAPITLGTFISAATGGSVPLGAEIIKYGTGKGGRELIS